MQCSVLFLRKTNHLDYNVFIMKLFPQYHQPYIRHISTLTSSQTQRASNNYFINTVLSDLHHVLKIGALYIYRVNLSVADMRQRVYHHWHF